MSASAAEAYGGAWSGTEIILTHRPDELDDDASYCSGLPHHRGGPARAETDLSNCDH